MTPPREWRVLLMGPNGSGKSRALRTVCDIGTPVQSTTGVTIGLAQLSQGARLTLCSAPDMPRLDDTWDALLQQCQGVVLLLNHASGQGRTDLDHFSRGIQSRTQDRQIPLVVGVTHTDLNPQISLSVYTDHILARRILACGVAPPVFAVDTRQRQQVQGLLLALLAQLEMAHRFPIVSPLMARP